MDKEKIKAEIITFIIGISSFFILDLFFWICNIFKYSYVNTNFIFTFLFGSIIYSLIWAISKKSSIATKKSVTPS